jgi:hypothetical protein
MNRGIRTVGLAALSASVTILLAGTSTTTTPSALLAATYMLPGSLGAPFTDQAKSDWTNIYVGGATGAAPPTPLNVVYWRSQLPSPASIESGSVLFAYSFGAFTAGTYKRDFNRYWANTPGEAPDVTFVLAGNTYRPNGGASARWGFGATPTETADAEDGEITTFDIVRQYDGAGDNPVNPLNFLAMANAAWGTFLVHPDYGSVNWDDAMYQGSHGDTEYYLIPTYPLPLLMPVEWIPVIGPALADMWDPVMRVLVEAGYDRAADPGEPTPYNIFHSPNPFTLVSNVLEAVRVGQDNWSENLGLGRPLGTERPGPYGVGGPPVETESLAGLRQMTALSAEVPEPQEPVDEGALSDPVNTGGDPPAAALAGVPESQEPVDDAEPSDPVNTAGDPPAAALAAVPESQEPVDEVEPSDPVNANPSDPAGTGTVVTTIQTDPAEADEADALQIIRGPIGPSPTSHRLHRPFGRELFTKLLESRTTRPEAKLEEPADLTPAPSDHEASTDDGASNGQPSQKDRDPSGGE